MKKILSTTCVLLLLSTIVLPAYSQSGFSNIGSFFNKNKQAETSQDNFDNALTIKEILIEGNRLISDESILEVIDSKVGARFDKDRILSDLQSIDKLGYFIHDSIQADPQQTESGVLLKIRIEENNPIARVQVIGNELVSNEELLTPCYELVGKPESLTKISQILDSIEKKYHERGFLLSRVSDISLDPDGTLTITVNEGAINKVNISGNAKTKEKYIRRFIPNLVSGEPYNEILLVQDLRELQGTGLFEDIHRTLAPSTDNPGKYDLNLEVVEKRNTSFGFGGGANTLNGLFANFGFSNNNLFGEGKQASINTQFGTGILANTLVDQRFLSNHKTIQAEARYSDQNFLGSKNQVSFFAHGYNFNSYLIDLAQERNVSLGASIRRPLGMNYFAGVDLIGEAVDMKDYGSKATDFLTDQVVNVDSGKYIGSFSETGAFKPGQSIADHNDSVKRDAAAIVAKELRDKQLTGGKYLNFNPSVSYDTRDNALSPRTGWNNKLYIGQAVGIGNDSFTKYGVDLRRYIPVGKKTTLAFNLQGASRLFGEIPMYGQFKPGGYYGVRGYRPFSDLGIGSRSLLASAEVRTPLLDTIPGLKNTPVGKDLRLVFFGDFGYVGGNKEINRLFNRLDTASSVGIGIRANVPMLGPIRVDYGIPLIQALWNNKNILGRFNFGFSDRF